MIKYSRRDFVKVCMITLGQLALGQILSSCENLSQDQVGEPSTAQSQESSINRSFFIDSVQGRDDAPGTESTVPWRTLANLNKTTLSPGDRVFLKSGSAWASETLHLRDGVIYESYGEGPRPIINGNNEVNCVVGDEVNSVQISNIELANGLDSCALFSKCSDVVINDCVMHGAGNDCCIFINGCSDAKILGGEFFAPYQRKEGTLVSCIEIADGGVGFLIDGAQVHGSPSAGITIHNHSAIDPQGTTDIPTDVVIRNVSAHNNGLAGINIMAQDVSAPTRIQIYNSELSSNHTGLRIHKTGNSAGYPNGEIVVDQCRILDNHSFGVYLQGDGIELSRTLIAGHTQQNFIVGAVDVKLTNNTFFTAPSEPIWALWATGNRTDNIVIRNSIFYVGTQSGQIIGTDEGVTKNLIIDYNAYYFPDYLSQRRWMWDHDAYSFDEWRGITGQDGHSFIIFDEVFVDPIRGDFTVLDNAAVVDEGMDTGRDFIGAAPDIGHSEK